MALHRAEVGFHEDKNTSPHVKALEEAWRTSARKLIEASLSDVHGRQIAEERLITSYENWRRVKTFSNIDSMHGIRN